LLKSDTIGDVFYDIPLGTVRHPNRRESFIPALTHAFLADKGKGVLLASRSGVQSLQVDASAGVMALCMGRSNTSGGRRKLSFELGDDVAQVKAEHDWYREPFFGEYVHHFVVHPFDGDWREAGIPVIGRAFSSGIHLVEAAGLPELSGRMAGLEPARFYCWRPA